MSPSLIMPSSPPAAAMSRHVVSNGVAELPKIGIRISGILHKWVNCGKRWKPRWFVLQDGVLSYYKIHGCDNIIVSEENDGGCRVIGSHLPHHRKPLGELHLKVSSIHESESDNRRFSIFTGTKILHLKANTREDQLEWMEALKTAKQMFPRISNKELMNSISSVTVSTEKLRTRLLKEGVKEETVQDAERVMRTEFLEMENQLVLVRKKLKLLIDKLALKFEDLVNPAPLDSPKLTRLFQIENREKISATATTPSQASTSSTTPVMSSAAPKLSAKFSLADLKTAMVKKEKGSETPASKPVHVPITRLKRKKGLETSVDLDVFDELSPEETKSKINLGVSHLFQMTQHNADELLKANDKIADLQKIALKKDGWYKQQENELRKELEDVKAELAEAKAQTAKELAEVKAQALAEKNVLIEEAQESATVSVFEAMFNMAKEAAAAGCLLPYWDVAAWAEMLGKPASEVPVLRIAEGADGDGQGQMMVDVGNEGDMNA